MSPADRAQMGSSIARWCLGLVAGTLLIAVTSPLFIRTYAGRVWDPVRGRPVYPEGLRYRWRSEGYATSTVGPHGMTGRTRLPASATDSMVALWGDSQAEGVCLPDDQKLWSLLEDELENSQRLNSVSVLPLAESGDDGWDWINQFAGVESRLGINVHVILVHELVDLESLLCVDPLISAEPSKDSPSISSKWLDRTPDFVLEAGRRLLLTDSNELRRLRFALGPTSSVSEAEALKAATFQSDVAWSIPAQRLRNTTKLPIVIAYAPHVRLTDELAGSSNDQPLRSELEKQQIAFIDCRERFRRSMQSGIQPFGFQNGRFGAGHLNRHGYRLIAEAVSSAIVGLSTESAPGS